jgi:hypothetical protein
MIKHIFYGYRGKQTLSNIKQSRNEYWLKINKFYKLINKDLFGNNLIIIIISIIIIIFINLFFERKKTKFETNSLYIQMEYYHTKFIKNTTTIKYIIILISTLMYFLFISKIAVYDAVRYIIPIYSLTFIEFYSLILLLIKKVIKNKFYFFSIIFLIFAFIFGNEWKIFWKTIFNSPNREEIENYPNLDCIFIYDKGWKILNYFFQINQCRMIKFIQNIHIKSKIFKEEEKKYKMILIILKNIKINVNKLIRFFPKINSYKNIKTNASLNIYYLYSK